MIIELGNTSYIPKRLFCIGRNYKAHAEEFNQKVPTSPVVFMKPASAILPVGKKISVPTHANDLHFETELVFLIGCEGKPSSPEDANRFIEGMALGLDLTLRDLQFELKEKGLPWEKSKAFDGSAPLSSFVMVDNDIDLANIRFTCQVNGETRQNGHSAKMIFDIQTLLMDLSAIWSFKPGDLIFTGTPEGVGSLNSGDTISIASDLIGKASWTVE